jgi:hypothetical protein
MVSRLVDAGWLVNQSVGRSASQPVVPQVGLLVCWLIGWLVDWSQGRILVEIVGQVEIYLGEVQQSSSRRPWKVRA